MRLSLVRCGVFAILVGLSQLPPARAQDDNSRGNRRQDTEQLAERLNQFAFLLQPGQEPSAKPDKGYYYPHGQLGALWARTPNAGALDLLAHHQNPYWGMSLVPVDDALRSHLKLAKDEGLLVTAIDPSSPAAQAGLHQNDVLLKLGDSPLSTPVHLEAALKAAADKPVVLHLYRDGRAREIQVQPRIEVSFGPAAVQPSVPQFWIGVSVADVEPALRAQLRLPADKGLLVNQVFKDSPADKAGLKVNDILLSIGGKPLADQKKLIELVQATGERTINVEVLHEGKPRGDLQITPERRKLTQVSELTEVNDWTKQFQTYRWNVVRPGVVVQTNPYQLQLQDLSALNFTQDRSKDNQSKDPTAALSKRLDDLDAEIKKLRKALEQIGGAPKAAAELNQIIELLKKRSADKK
ncbi:MAG: PDZ domain-containing protein [Isosphaeraceae bacterium]